MTVIINRHGVRATCDGKKWTSPDPLFEKMLNLYSRPELIEGYVPDMAGAMTLRAMQEIPDIELVSNDTKRGTGEVDHIGAKALKHQGGTFITFFQHHPDGHPGRMADLCRAQGIPYSIVNLYSPDSPTMDPATTHLIMMGGDQEMDDLVKVRETYPHFDWELQVVRSFITANKSVLGICLGAEIIAVALGITVRKAGREYGWGEVEVLGLPGLPDMVHVFEYHDDSFELPQGARLLMTSEKVRNQCFTFDRVLGTQFHPEVTREMIYKWTSDASLWEPSFKYEPESKAVAAAIFNFFMGLGTPEMLYDGTTNVWVLHGSSSSGNYGHAGRPGERGGSLPGGGSGAVEEKGFKEFRPAITEEDAYRVMYSHIGTRPGETAVRGIDLHGATLDRLNAINKGLQPLGDVKISSVRWMTDEERAQYKKTSAFYDAASNQIAISKEYVDDPQKNAESSQRGMKKQVREAIAVQKERLKIIDTYGEEGAKARGMTLSREYLEHALHNGETVKRWCVSTDPSLKGLQHLEVTMTHEAEHAVHEQLFKERWNWNLKRAVESKEIENTDVYSVSQYAMSANRPSEIFSEVACAKIYGIPCSQKIISLYDRTVRAGPITASERRAMLEERGWAGDIQRKIV